MLARIRKSVEDNENGFTLIELLVVIIIIGILAAIAIPVFLSQRTKGYDAQAKSDVRNFATQEETYFVDKNTYGTGAAVITNNGAFRRSSTDVVKVESYSATGFCLSAVNAPSAAIWYYDSGLGGLQPAGAPSCAGNYATVDGVALP